MSDRNDGGPAFPKTGNFSNDKSGEFDSLDQDGMSLRDCFAIKAMQGLLASAYFDPSKVMSTKTTRESFCSFAWMLADAMLETRNK